MMKRSYKIFVLLFIAHCSLFIVNCYAQPVTQEWVARYTGPSNDLTGPFFQVDKLGNSYVTGTHVINDSINILCVKYNTSGAQVWATLYKYQWYGYYTPWGIALDSSGNAYVISDYGQGTSYPYNALIVKFNSLNGSVVWSKTYTGDYGWSSFQDIKIDRFNNIYIAGWSDSSHLVIRYNTNGDSVWARKYHPPSCREFPEACTIDDSLNVIFTGGRRHFFYYGYSDSLLTAKYSSTGILRWESVYASSNISANVGTNITADQYGNVYVGGVTTISGHSVYLTMKYNGNGAQQWSKIYDEPAGDNTIGGIAIDKINNALFVTGTNGLRKAATIRYNPSTGDSVWVRTDTGNYKYGSSSDVIVDTSGNIYITGQTNNIPPGSAIDALTIKYSIQGNRLWQITYNGPYNGVDGGLFLGLDNLYNVFVLGSSQSAFQLSDYIIIKYSQVVGVKAVSNTIPSDFKLTQNYPNPFNSSSKFKMQISKLSAVMITIYDILGRKVENFVDEKLNPGTYEISINGTNYPSGVYFYQLTTNGNIIDTKKFILIK